MKVASDTYVQSFAHQSRLYTRLRRAWGTQYDTLSSNVIYTFGNSVSYYTRDWVLCGSSDSLNSNLDRMVHIMKRSVTSTAYITDTTYSLM